MVDKVVDGEAPMPQFKATLAYIFEVLYLEHTPWYWKYRFGGGENALSVMLRFPRRRRCYFHSRGFSQVAISAAAPARLSKEI